MEYIEWVKQWVFLSKAPAKQEPDDFETSSLLSSPSLDNKLSQLNGQGKLLQSKAYFKGVNINGIKCRLGYLLLINSCLVAYPIRPN